MIKRFLCCFSVVLALSVPMSRVYADPTVEEAILQAVSNALYTYATDWEGNRISQGVLQPPWHTSSSTTIWDLLEYIREALEQDIPRRLQGIRGDFQIWSQDIWNVLSELGYGDSGYDEMTGEYGWHWNDGKSLSQALQDPLFIQKLAVLVSENQMRLFFDDPYIEVSGIGNFFPIFASALFSGGGGGGGEFPTQVKIDIKNILENSITNNVVVSNILDVLTNPNSRQTNVLNISLTNISHYASNTVDVATQIRDILKEILENQTNHNDGLDTSINWMTNNWPDSTAAPPIGGSASSNGVWSVWVPSGGYASFDSPLNNYFVPKVVWEHISGPAGLDYYKPTYAIPESQPDNFSDTYYGELMGLLQDYRTNGIDGQQFVAGLLFLQSRMMGQVSTQLYMLHEKIGITKTNLWNSINEETNWVRDNAESVKNEVEGQQYQVENLLNKADTSIISTYFPKVQTAISRLNTTSNDPVVRLPLPAVFGSGSGSSVWTIDVREIQGHDRLRKFIRWVCIIVWSIIFVRTFIVPSLVILCLCARFSDMACGLLFVDSLDGCHVMGETVGGLSEFILNLIGLDTNLKRWAVGVSSI